MKRLFKKGRLSANSRTIGAGCYVFNLICLEILRNQSKRLARSQISQIFPIYSLVLVVLSFYHQKS